MNSPNFPEESRAGGSCLNPPKPKPRNLAADPDNNHRGDCFLPKLAAALANPAVCRARRRKAGGFVYCLVANAYACPFGERIDYDLICCHPDREKIVFRTEARGPS